MTGGEIGEHLFVAEGERGDSELGSLVGGEKGDEIGQKRGQGFFEQLVMGRDHGTSSLRSAAVEAEHCCGARCAPSL